PAVLVAAGLRARRALRFARGGRARAARGGIGALDQQPVVLVLARVALRHAHERPAAAQAVAVQLEVELAVAEAALRVAERLPVAAVPDHHRSRAVLGLRDLAFERAVLERMVLGL